MTGCEKLKPISEIFTCDIMTASPRYLLYSMVYPYGQICIESSRADSYRNFRISDYMIVACLFLCLLHPRLY